MPSAFLSSKPGGPYLDSTPPVVWDNDGLWITMNYYYYYFTCMVWVPFLILRGLMGPLPSLLQLWSCTMHKKFSSNALFWTPHASSFWVYFNLMTGVVSYHYKFQVGKSVFTDEWIARIHSRWLDLSFSGKLQLGFLECNFSND